MTDFGKLVKTMLCDLYLQKHVCYGKYGFNNTLLNPFWLIIGIPGAGKEEKQEKVVPQAALELGSFERFRERHRQEKHQKESETGRC